MKDQITLDAMQTAEKVLDMFSEIDEKIAWKDLINKVKHFDELREYYSQNTAGMVGNLQMNLMNSIDLYLEASRHVAEWCAII